MNKFTCIDCKQEKAAGEFYKRNDKKRGHTPRCKPCHKAFVGSRPNYEADKQRRQRRREEARKTPLTLEVLKADLHYEPDTGRFMRLTTKGKFKAGTEAGSIHTNTESNTQYRIIAVNQVRHWAHRLAYFYMTGTWPEQVDHINGDGLDNSWANLRAVDGHANQRNIPLRKANKSGIHGVRLQPNGKHHVSIGVDNKAIYLGLHGDFFEACCIRKSAENRYGYHPNHGRIA